MKKTMTISAAAIAALFALTGCAAGSGTGSSDTGSMPGMNHGSSPMPPSSAPAASDLFNDADTMFAQMMIPHHAQAVTMSEIILAKEGISASIKDLANRIKAAQGPEIEKMTGWLQGWGQSTEMPADMSSAHSMQGMMGAEDMARLKATQGTEAAKLFLTQMIAHHEGAVMMAKAETTGGKNPDAVQLSKDIVSSQETEIQEMKQMLATL